MFLVLVLFALASAEQLAIRLTPGTDPARFSAQHRLRHLRRIAQLSNYHLFEELEPENPALHVHPGRSSEVEWLEPQVKRQLARREEEIITTTTLSDPEFELQWHLDALNVPDAWLAGYAGRGVVVSVLDDGLQAEHPELEPAYQAQLSYDVNDQRPVPLLGPADIHGTPAAGLAGARHNSVCGVGIAYLAQLAGVRVVSRMTDDAEEAQAISTGAPDVHIYSASWGPVDDARRLEGPGHLSREVLEASVRGSPLHPQLHGRGGLGTIYVWAAGNGGKLGDNCNYDGWANSRYTVAVSAVTDAGLSPDYAESCAALLTSAPSSGGTHAIVTADLLGPDGYSEGDCTGRFSGTSASTPMVAGVVALMLEARPELGWRDVQHILVLASHPLDSDPGQLNGAGLWYSHRFGFGLLDAALAVQLALGWELVGREAVVEYASSSSVVVPTKQPAQQILCVVEEFELEHVEVVFSALHPHRGQLEIWLTSPAGTLSRLAEPHRDFSADYAEWTLVSTACWGEQSRGNWTLSVLDHGTRAQGRWTGWRLRLWGQSAE